MTTKNLKMVIVTLLFCNLLAGLAIWSTTNAVPVRDGRDNSDFSIFVECVRENGSERQCVARAYYCECVSQELFACIECEPTRGE